MPGRIIIICMLLLLAGCGVPEPAAPSVSAPPAQAAPTVTPLASAASLAGTEWTLESFGPDDAPQPPLADTTITLQFTDTEVGGSLGCNVFGGDYTVNGQQLTFPELVQTLMACAEPINQQEQQLSKALQSVQSFALDGDTLRLTYPDGVLRFTRVPPQPDKALDGPLWQLDAVVGNDAAQSLIAGTQITARFADGRVAGSAGCNEYAGTYTVNNGVLSVGSDIAATKKACQPDVMQQEQEFLSALAATTGYAISGAQLTLSHGDGQLVFRAQE